MGEHQQQAAKKHQRMEFDELAAAPLEASGAGQQRRGRPQAGTWQALGIRTVREFAEHRLVRRAQARS
jgi:hypothetical protein